MILFRLHVVVSTITVFSMRRHRKEFSRVKCTGMVEGGAIGGFRLPMNRHEDG
jgi:hypothetical protein